MNHTLMETKEWAGRLRDADERSGGSSVSPKLSRTKSRSRNSDSFILGSDRISRRSYAACPRFGHWEMGARLSLSRNGFRSRLSLS